GGGGVAPAEERTAAGDRRAAGRGAGAVSREDGGGRLGGGVLGRPDGARDGEGPGGDAGSGGVVGGDGGASAGELHAYRGGGGQRGLPQGRPGRSLVLQRDLPVAAQLALAADGPGRPPGAGRGPVAARERHRGVRPLLRLGVPPGDGDGGPPRLRPGPVEL